MENFHVIWLKMHMNQLLIRKLFIRYRNYFLNVNSSIVMKAVQKDILCSA